MGSLEGGSRCGLARENPLRGVQQRAVVTGKVTSRCGLARENPLRGARRPWPPCRRRRRRGATWRGRIRCEQRGRSAARSTGRWVMPRTWIAVRPGTRDPLRGCDRRGIHRRSAHVAVRPWRGRSAARCGPDNRATTGAGDPLRVAAHRQRAPPEPGGRGAAWRERSAARPGRSHSRCESPPGRGAAWRGRIRCEGITVPSCGFSLRVAVRPGAGESAASPASSARATERSQRRRGAAWRGRIRCEVWSIRC